LQVSLSTCLIIKNEEKYLHRCLSSIKDIASQIIVVDTGSTDKSILIASEFSEQVYSYKWKDDFSAARNFCLDKADGDWVLVLDGDEELDGKCLNLLLEKIQVQDIDAYSISVNHYSKNPQELLDFPDLQVRLFRNNNKYRYRGIIDEQIMDSIIECDPSARIEMVRDINIIHYGYFEGDIGNRNRLNRNTDLINKTLDKEKDILRQLFLGREYYRHHRFAEALEKFLPVYNKGDIRADYFPDLLRSIAVSLYMLNRTGDALDLLESALSILPDMGDLHYIKATIYKNNSNYREAFQIYEECLSINDQASCYSGIFCQHRDKIYFNMGGLAEYFMDKDRALYFFLESLKQNPYMLDSLRRIIVILNPRINPEYTVECLNRVFDLSDRALKADMALMFYEEGAYQLALDNIGQLENSGPISEYIRVIKGLSLLRNKQYSLAEDDLQYIYDNQGLYILARQYLLVYYWLKQDYRKAAGCLKRIKNAGADPTPIYVLNLLIRGYADNTHIVQDQAYRLAGQILELVVEQGEIIRIDEAFQNLAPLLGERPSRLLAELYFKYEKYQMAEEEFRHLLETDHTDAQALYYLGKSCWARGDLKNAAEYLCQATYNGLETPKIRWETARLYQELAIASLREGIRQCPASKDTLRVLQNLEDDRLEL